MIPKQEIDTYGTKDKDKRLPDAEITDARTRQYEKEGGKKNCRGKNGNDIVIKVPAGTVVKEAESGPLDRHSIREERLTEYAVHD